MLEGVRFIYFVWFEYGFLNFSYWLIWFRGKSYSSFWEGSVFINIFNVVGFDKKVWGCSWGSKVMWLFFFYERCLFKYIIVM